MIKVKVSINGSEVNPWARMGLRCNPFPKIAKAEYEGLNEAFRRLDSEPIPTEDDLRRILENVRTELRVPDSEEYRQFVAACVANYKPGERTTFDLSIDE